MNLENKRIWQQAAGDNNRNYVDLCLRWDVILSGPGHHGHWLEGEQKLLEAGHSGKKITNLRRFCEDVSSGDLVVLRLGTSQIYGVGEVVGGYEWLDIFGDVDGWHLQHVRRVRWLWKGSDAPKEFSAHTLKFGDTTQELSSPDVTSWLQELDIPPNAWNRSLVALPSKPDEEPVKLDDISEFLFDKGVASRSIENLMREIDELIRIARWYQKPGNNNPSEFETVAYLVIPLLRALGWTPQKMAIEWNHVDAALFSGLPRSDDTLAVVVEAKKKDDSCLSAKSQAETYARTRQYCRRLIVTDGIRFGIYSKQDSSFYLHAYMNLTRLKASYPIYGCGGAKEAVLAMTPEWS